MAIRLTVDGSVFEVDTPAEAAELHRVLARKESASKAATARWQPKHQKRAVKKDSGNPLAVLLWTQYPKSLTSDEVAKALGVKRTSLPPRWGHLKSWISTLSNGKLSFDDVIEREPNPNGAGSIFKLTKVGADLIENLGKEN